MEWDCALRPRPYSSGGLSSCAEAWRQRGARGHFGLVGFLATSIFYGIFVAGVLVHGEFFVPVEAL